jgi:hypothetical protein
VDLIRRRVVEVQRLDHEIAEIKRLVSATLRNLGQRLWSFPESGPSLQPRFLAKSATSDE